MENIWPAKCYLFVGLTKTGVGNLFDVKRQNIKKFSQISN